MEYFNKLAEYRANFYFPTSGDRLVNEDTSSYIRAVRGLDYEMGTSFTNARWLSLYAGGYYYDNKYSDAEKGYRLRSTMQVSPRFMLEMGYMKSNLTSGEFYGKIQYQLADVLSPSLGKAAKMAKTSNDLSYKLLQKVHRENKIKTETFSKASKASSDKLGSIEVTTNMDGDLYYEYPTSVTIKGEGVEKTEPTTNGVVRFGDLRRGNYTLSVQHSIEGTVYVNVWVDGTNASATFEFAGGYWTLN